METALYLEERQKYLLDKIEKHKKILKDYKKFLIIYRLYIRIILNDNQGLVIQSKKARLSNKRKLLNEIEVEIARNNRILSNLEQRIERTKSKIMSEENTIYNAKILLDNIKKMKAQESVCGF